MKCQTLYGEKIFQNVMLKVKYKSKRLPLETKNAQKKLKNRRPSKL